MKEVIGIDMSDVNEVKATAITLTKMFDEGYDIEKIVVVGNNDLFEIELKK